MKNPRPPLLGCFLALAFTSLSLAADSFFPFPRRPLTSQYDCGGQGQYYAAADVNGDGKTDLVIATTSGVSVMIATGGGSFQRCRSLFSQSISEIRFAGRRPDGGVDLAGRSGGGLIIISLNPAGDAASSKTVPLRRSPDYWTAGDLNGAGIADIAAIDANREVSILRARS